MLSGHDALLIILCPGTLTIVFKAKFSKLVLKTKTSISTS